MSTQVDWMLDNVNTFIAGVGIQELLVGDDIVDAYRSYLDRWQTLAHPSAMHFEDIEFCHQQDDELLARIKIPAWDGYERCENSLAKLTLLEKIFVLKQTFNLARCLHERAFPVQEWSMSHLYLHASGNCLWLPLSPPGWKQNLPNSTNWLEKLAAFACELLYPLISKIEYGGQELSVNRYVPWEWECMVTQWRAPESLSQGNLDACFRFVFFQAWIYSLIVKFAMGDSMGDKMIAPSQFPFLQTFRELLGLSQDAAEALEVLALMKNPSWDNVVAIVEQGACD